MDLEIKIRRRTPEEIAERQRAEDAKPKCFFCGRKAYIALPGYTLEFDKWLEAPICNYCHTVTYEYCRRYFSDDNPRAHRVRDKRPYEFAKEEQIECARLFKLLTTLKSEIQLAVARAK